MHVKPIVIHSEQTVSDDDNIELPINNEEYAIKVSNNKFQCSEEIATKVANKLSQSKSSSESELPVFAHTNICAEIVKPCSNLSKDRSHYEFKRVRVKNNNVQCFHRVQNHKPTIELCSNDKLIKCLIDTGSDRTIIKFEKLCELESEPKIIPSKIKVQGLNSSAQVVGETEFCLKLPTEKIVVKAIILKQLKFKADLILGNDLLQKTDSILSYAEKNISINGVIIPFIGNDGDYNHFDRTNCLVADFEYVSRTSKKKANRAARKLLTVETNVVHAKEDIKLSGHPGDDKSINDNNKKLRNIEAREKREEKIKLVHVLHDVIIPSNCFKCVTAYAKLAPGEYLINKSHLPNGLYVADGIIEIRSFDDRSFPVAIVNVTDNELVIKENSQLTTAESCENIKYIATVADHLGKEVNKQIRRFLKQKNNTMDSDDSRCTSLQKEQKGTSKSNYRLKGIPVGMNYMGLVKNRTVKEVPKVSDTCTRLNKSNNNANNADNGNTNNNGSVNDDNNSKAKELSSASNGPTNNGNEDNNDRNNSYNNWCDIYNKLLLLQDAVKSHLQELESFGDVVEHETKKSMLQHHKTLNDPSNSRTSGDCLIKECKQPAEARTVMKTDDRIADSECKADSCITDTDCFADCCKCDTSDIKQVNHITLKDRIGDITLEDIKVNDDIPLDIKNDLIKLLNEYRLVCAKPSEKFGLTNKMTYSIKLKDPTLVINVPPYRVAHKFQGMMYEELQKLKDDGIISESLSAFNAPVLCVQKPCNSIRIVVDYRKLNKNIELHSFSLPNINDILHSLGGATVFSTLDLKSAFHQIPLDEQSKQFTAFSVGDRKYHFNRLPFGLATSPSVYQALMSRVLQDLLGIIAYCYVDDIIIFSQNHSEHLQHLRQVFKRLQEAHLTLKLEKCAFFQKEIKYLGHIVNSKGFTCENNFKLSECPRPTDVKQLQRFLGMTNYFRKFIPLFSTIALHLYKLLRANVPFIWDNDCEVAFQKLKNILHSETTLAHPDYSKSFVLFTDSSNHSCGGCLAQPNEDGVLQPLGYFSKTLTKSQMNYSTTKKEAFALVSSLKHFQYILLGYPTIVCTDHRPLISLFSKKLPTDTALARWCLSIQSFNLELKHYPGKFNCVADYLSRLPNPLSIDKLENSPVLATSDGNIIIDDDIESPDECVTLLASEKPLVKYIPTLEEVSWSLEELKEAQKHDDFCVSIAEQFAGKIINKDNGAPTGVPGLNSFLYLDGILYKRRKIDNNKLLIMNLVVPTSLMEKAINSIHYVLHGDLKHTIFKFRFRYYHQYENRYIKRFVESCDVCKILKGKAPKPISLKQAPIPSKPFDQVSMDIIGPLPVTDNGNRYILCVIDLFSRFCVLKALPSKETTGIIDCLLEIFNYWGFPSVLLSDNALEFCSQALHQFTNIYSIRKTTVLPYAPFSNGIVERNNTKILKLLRLYVNSVERSCWDSYISTASNVINNSLNLTLNDTASYACMGFDTSPNISRTELKDIYNYDSPESLITIREKRSNEIREHIRQVIMETRHKQHLQANKKRINRDVTPSCRVLFKNHGKTSKLDLNYLGPAVVTSVDNQRLTVKINDKIYDRVHINHCILLNNKSTLF